MSKYYVCAHTLHSGYNNNEIFTAIYLAFASESNPKQRRNRVSIFVELPLTAIRRQKTTHNQTLFTFYRGFFALNFLGLVFYFFSIISVCNVCIFFFIHTLLFSCNLMVIWCCAFVVCFRSRFVHFLYWLFFSPFGFSLSFRGQCLQALYFSSPDE